MEEVNFEINLSSEEIKDIRKLIVDAASNIDSSSGKRLKLSDIDCSKELLDKIVFDNFKTQWSGTYKTIFNELKKLMSKIDFDGVSFDSALINSTDFTGSKGVKINPQTIFFKNLSNTVCSGVEFIGPFDGVDLFYTDFTGSKGAMINPQTIHNKNLCGTVCTDAKFTGPFDDVKINDETSLDGSNVRYKDLYERIEKSIKKLIK